MESVLCIFPGQGAHYPGMGRDLHQRFVVAQDTYAEASEALGYDIATLSFSPDGDDITKTEFAQPALLTHSIACFRVGRSIAGDALNVGACAGHSVGEYAALVVGGALAFGDALRLVRARGEAMEAHGYGGMRALKTDLPTATALAERHFCELACVNADKQSIVGGAEADLEALAATAEAEGIFSVPLATAGAFHTHLMVRAALKFRHALAAVEFAAPAAPVYSNYTGAPHPADADAVRASLFFQLFRAVRWADNMAHALASHSLVLEFGGGLGAGDEPASKRPNLLGLTRTAFRSAGVKGEHLAFINVATIEASTKRLGGPARGSK